MDEVTFLITLIDENWTNATVDTGSGSNFEAFAIDNATA